MLLTVRSSTEIQQGEFDWGNSIMRTFNFIASICIGCLATPTIAMTKDLLPLKRGIFVQSDQPCIGPGYFAILGFYGDRLAPAHNSCDILKVHKSGNLFHLDEECSDLPSSDSVRRSEIYKISNSLTFEVSEKGSKGSISYHWCAENTQLMWP